MATIEFFTGFEGCEDITDVRTLFNSVSGNVSFSSSNGHNESKSIKIDSAFNDDGYCTKKIAAAKTVVCGFHVRGVGTNEYATGPEDHLIRMNADGTYIRVFNTSNGLEVYRGDTLIISSSYTISTDMTHVEFKIYSHSSEGTFDLKINGELKINETNLNTTGNDITEVLFANMDRRGAYFDNIFIADDWIGELKTQLLQPTSDDSVQFTPSDGSDNYAMLQDNDGDDNYVYSDTVDHKDLYGYGPDVADDQYVKGVFVQTVARKDDTDARSLQTVMEVESTEYDLDEYVLPNEYPTTKEEVQFQVLSKAPDDTDWTYEKVNGMKVGFKVSA